MLSTVTSNSGGASRAVTAAAAAATAAAATATATAAASVVQLDHTAVDFLWGIESAHDETLTLIRLVPTEPRALLTAGADRCVAAQFA
jgi:hypothetical protein